jgi:general secretion pathway protein G
MILRQTKLLSRGVRSAFTLMEMMVVVAILVVLVSVAVPSYMSYLESSKMKAARTNVETLSAIAKKYNLDFGQYPDSLQTLANTPQPGGTAKYCKIDDLMDPWDQPYQYDVNGAKMQAIGGEGPDIWSNGKPGTQNPIGNWMKMK